MTAGIASTQLFPVKDVKPHVDEESKLKTSFGRLPDEIIEQILRICDPNTFASLVVLNRSWRRVSQQPHLYVHHLSQCQVPSLQPTAPLKATEERLPYLRSAFAQVVKRNLFEAYLRPNETIITLVSNSISSSSAFPGGEAFHFSFSPNGHHILAYSSSRIYVIKTVDKDLSVTRELKILRRPASVTILDDGSVLAVLSTDHQVDIYNLAGEHPKHVRAVALDHAPRTIALSPTGSVMAAAYDGGVEVYSLTSPAAVADRRAVKCDPADSLSFSQDGTQLLGTTLNSKNPSTVVLTAPYYDPGDFLPEDTVSHLWTTSIIFPNSSRDCSHAVLLPSPSNDESSWTFTYDRVFETFRAVRIDDLRNGTTYFTGPTPDLAQFGKLLPSTLPTSTASGELVAAGFQGKEIWLYGVPEDLDSPPDPNQSTTNGVTGADAETAQPSSSLGRVPSLRNSHTWPSDPNSNRIPQWQLLCDSSRNKFVEGRKIDPLKGVSALKWITGRDSRGRSAVLCSERLVAVAPGVAGQQQDAEDESIVPIDGGRISILDFDYLPSGGKKTILTIEVGDKEPETLEEEHRDMETEVAIVRRRTVAQRRGNRADTTRSVTVAIRSPPNTGSLPSILAADSFSPSVLPLSTIERGRLAPTDDQPETASLASFDEEQEALDAPYAHGAPRSGTTLRRAATAAAINRRLHPPRIVAGPVEYRRADGREEHPHESDADNWVPPPPPYTRDPVARVPKHLENAVLASSVPPSSTNTLHRSSTQRSSSSAESNILTSLQRSRTAYLPNNSTTRQVRYSPRRTLSDSTMMSSSTDSFDDVRRPAAQETSSGFDPLYDVSPPSTPPSHPSRPAPTVFAAPPFPGVSSNSASQIPRRPVGTGLPGTPASNSPPSLQMIPPVSPLYSQAVLNGSPNGNEMFQSRESVMESASGSRPSTGSTSLTQTRLDAPVPSRPNEDHRMTEIPSTIPQQQVTMDRPNFLPPQREPPPTPFVPTENENVQPGLDMPSASQLARLSSRSGRPSSLNNPSRRGSGTLFQPQFGSSIEHSILSRRLVSDMPQQDEPPGIRNFTPQLRYSSYGSSSQSPVSHSAERDYSPTQSLSRRSDGQGLLRQMSGSSSSNLRFRPRIQRLDTIQSITSDSGPPTGPMRSPGILRKPSRAERSAAINIQKAKERGWRGTVKKDKKKKKKKDRDGASSAGWTDVSMESGMKENDKKEIKCVVM